MKSPLKQSMPPGIDFGDDPTTRRTKTWTAVSDEEMRRRAHSPEFRGVERLEAAARWRMNRTGHAGFHRGELGDILGVRRSRVYELVTQAVARGMLAPGSNPMCLIVPWEVGQRGTGDTMMCRIVHRVADDLDGEDVDQVDQVVAYRSRGPATRYRMRHAAA